MARKERRIKPSDAEIARLREAKVERSPALFGPKMFFGHNMHHMTPFSNPRHGFCMVFRCAPFLCWVPWTHLWKPEPKLGPGVSKFSLGWAQAIFEPALEKLLFGNGFKINILGNPVTQMDRMGSRRPLGEVIPLPKPSPNQVFQ